MNETVIVALIAFAGTIGGSLLGALSTAKLTNFRLQKLEEEVRKHNNLVERVYIIEGELKKQESEIEHNREALEIMIKADGGAA